MKKVLIGGFLSIIGSIWALAMALVVENNLASSWSTPPGRLLTTVQEMGLMALFPAAVFLAAVFSKRNSKALYPLLKDVITKLNPIP